MHFKLLVFSSLILLMGCTEKDHYAFPTKSKNGKIQAVIEIPAGTHHKIEYNPETKNFECDQVNGQNRVIKYLGYPANYGFIPSTYMDTLTGGDGDPLDVLVISSQLQTGQTVEVDIMGVMKLTDNGEDDFKIIAVAANEQQKVVDLSGMEDMEKYRNMKNILALWFTSYKKNADLKIESWGDRKEALELIEKYSK